MIAQLVLSILLGAILLYSWIEYRRSPAVALLTVVVAAAGTLFRLGARAQHAAR